MPVTERPENKSADEDDDIVLRVRQSSELSEPFLTTEARTKEGVPRTLSLDIPKEDVRLNGLSLRFDTKEDEDEYQTWRKMQSRRWMVYVLLFQCVLEIFLAGMNVFTFFETSDEFVNDADQTDVRRHAIITIVFHILCSSVFLGFFLVVYCKFVEEMPSMTLAAWYFLTASFHMFIDFEIEAGAHTTAVAIGLLAAFHTVQIVLLSGLSWVLSFTTALAFSAVLYTSVLCSTGVCKGLVGPNGEDYGNQNDQSVRGWGLSAVICAHFLVLISVCYFSFWREFYQREVYVRSKKLQIDWLRLKQRSKPFSPTNLEHYLNPERGKSVFDLSSTADILADLSPAERKVVLLRPLTRWRPWGGSSSGPQSRSDEEINYRTRVQSREHLRRAIEPWFIDSNSIKVSSTQRLGAGGNGTLFKGTYLGAPVALKELHVLKMAKDESDSDFTELSKEYVRERE